MTFEVRDGGLDVALGNALPVRLLDDVIWRSACDVTGCEWESGPWPSRDEAAAVGEAHLYAGHRDAWLAIRGDAPPAGPDPRGEHR